MKQQKSRRFLGFSVLALLPVLLLLFFAVRFLSKSPREVVPSASPTEAFDAFADRIFSEEMKHDTIARHFLIKNEDALGLQDVALGLVFSDEDSQKRKLLALKEELLSFSYEVLSKEQQMTYDCLLFQLENRLSCADYADLSNPFSPQSGMQQQLPFLLSEYRLDSKKDLAAYFSLLDSVYPYTEALLSSMQKRSVHTVPLVAVQKAIEQCRSFLQTPLADNILITGFRERMSALEYHDEIELAVYEMKNRYRVETEILPAYELLLEYLTAYEERLIDAASSENPLTPSDNSTSTPSAPSVSRGLSSFSGGKEYYTLLSQAASSCTLTVPQMKELLLQYFNRARSHMKALSKKNPSLLQQTSNALRPDGSSLYSAIEGLTASDIVQFLRQKSETLLPALSDIENLQITIKDVAPCLQHMSAPAMYLLCPMDAPLSHTVYRNPLYTKGSDSLTTIAHEAFPGHLCARVCFLSEKPHPLRNILDFIGWDEGWASFAELLALSFLDGGDTSEFLFASELSALCLYGLSDIGIHYEGWSEADTIAFWSNYGMDAASAGELFSLIVSEPAYYLPYALGLVQMLELRSMFSEATGDAFSERDFCSRLLALGPMPFSACQKYLLSTPLNKPGTP